MAAPNKKRANVRARHRNGLGAAMVATARCLLTAAVLILPLICSDDLVRARELLAGDVERVKMIGFTVSDIDRETDFFVKVLQFEKVSDFRILGSEYDRMQGVFNANMRIVHLQSS